MSERAKVLEMVADGTISVEEGEKLLDALGRAEQQEHSDDDRAWGDQGWEPEGLGPQRHRVHRTRSGARTVERHRVRFRDMDEQVGANPGFDRLVKLGMFGITPEYLKQIKDAGLGDLTFEQIITLGKFGVSPDYVKKMRDVFGEEMTFDKIVALGKFGVSARFVEEVKEAGLGELDFHQVVKLAKFGISPTYIKEMKEAGVMEFANSLSEESDDDDQDD